MRIVILSTNRTKTENLPRTAIVISLQKVGGKLKSNNYPVLHENKHTGLSISSDSALR